MPDASTLTATSVVVGLAFTAISTLVLLVKVFGGIVKAKVPTLDSALDRVRDELTDEFELKLGAVSKGIDALEKRVGRMEDRVFNGGPQRSTWFRR